MDGQRLEGRSKMATLRRKYSETACEAYGEEMDLMDDFLVLLDDWRHAFLHITPSSGNPMKDKVASREQALGALFAECVLSLGEISIMLRAGLARPAMFSLRKLYETYVDTRFIELDGSGDAAFRWVHWGVAERSKLRPDDSVAARELSWSRSLIDDKKNLGKAGCWARVWDGKAYKTYRALSDRAEFVDRSNSNLFGYEQEMSDFANMARKELLDKTNALAHPTLAGNENLFPPKRIIFLAVFYTFFALVAYRNGIGDHRELIESGLSSGESLFVYPEGNDHLVSLSREVHEVFNRLTSSILKSM